MRKLALLLILYSIAGHMTGQDSVAHRSSLQFVSSIAGSISTAVPDLYPIQQNISTLYYQRRVRAHWGYAVGLGYESGYHTSDAEHVYVSQKPGYNFTYAYSLDHLWRRSFMMPVELYYDFALGRSKKFHISPYVGIYASYDRAKYSLYATIAENNSWVSGYLSLFSEDYLDAGLSARLDLSYDISDRFAMGLSYHLRSTFITDRELRISDKYDGREIYETVFRPYEEMYMDDFMKEKLFSNFYVNNALLKIALRYSFK